MTSWVPEREFWGLLDRYSYFEMAIVAFVLTTLVLGALLFALHRFFPTYRAWAASKSAAQLGWRLAGVFVPLAWISSFLALGSLFSNEVRGENGTVIWVCYSFSTLEIVLSWLAMLLPGCLVVGFGIWLRSAAAEPADGAVRDG